MKNKGFTLIELLVVVAILGVIGIVITISVTGSLNDQNQKSCDSFVKELEDAACVYAGLTKKEVPCNRTSCPPLSVQTLVSAGLVSSEIDACTGNKVEDLTDTITVVWNSDGEKICTYNGEKRYAR